MYLFTVNNNIQQYWFIDCNKYPALTSNINKGELQCLCGSKTFLKQKIHFKKIGPFHNPVPELFLPFLRLTVYIRISKLLSRSSAFVPAPICIFHALLNSH